MRNLRPDLNGIFPVHKPLEWTSAGVCRLVRNRSGGAKVGHAGTLDPLASGVLVLCLGRATKLIEQLQAMPKRYTATIDLARTSTTDDREGEITPADVDHPPTLEEVKGVCAQFLGEIRQTPPAHSAVWVDGERAYKKARRGEAPRVEPRAVRIDAIEVLAYDWPTLKIDVRCGKGTYIRSLARDLGVAMGTGGMLSDLVRTESSGFSLDDCVSVELIDAQPDFEPLLIEPDRSRSSTSPPRS